MIKHLNESNFPLFICLSCLDNVSIKCRLSIELFCSACISSAAGGLWPWWCLGEEHPLFSAAGLQLRCALNLATWCTVCTALHCVDTGQCGRINQMWALQYCDCEETGWGCDCVQNDIMDGWTATVFVHLWQMHRILSETRAANEPSVKFSQSRSRPLVGSFASL